MQLIVQPPLFPEIYERSWLQLPPYAWEYQAEEVVNRRTENAALRRVFGEAKLFSKKLIPLLTPKHRQAHRLEIEFKQRHPHYSDPDIHEAIAAKMHITTKQVKAILNHTELIFILYCALGWEHLLTP